ncbi:MAG: divergent polysaccharide deacetylase family protein [Rhodospirillaceae bacterium]
MGFLKKLFKRSSDDEDEDLDDDYGDDDDTPSAVVIMDDDEDDSSDADDDDSGPSIQERQLAALGAQMAEDDVSLFGTGSQVEGGGDDGPVGKPGGKKKLMFIAAGVAVLVLGIAGGAAFWFMGGSPKKAAEAPIPEGAIQMALPPKAGSLNAVDSETGDRPPSLNQQVATGQQGAPAEGAQPGGGEAAGQTQGQTQAPGAAAQPAGILTMPEAGGGGSLNALAGATSGLQGLVLPSVTAASYGRAEDLQRGVPLAAAPDKGLLEKVDGVDKPLPKIDPRGRKPWEVYARPLTGSEQGQHVALMITGLGLSRAATIAAIRKLPAEVSLVFEPYAPDLEDWLMRARLAGHEVFVSLPMESGKFPNEDPGPLALTTTVQVAENIRRLRAVLGSFGGYVGVVSTMGSKFSVADGQLKPVLQVIMSRGLMYVDAPRGTKSSAPTLAAEIDLPVVKSNVLLDEPPASGTIQRNLRNLETFVSKNSTAIATARPYPVSIHQIQAWTRTLAEKKLVLVPVSSLVGKQFIE